MSGHIEGVTSIDNHDNGRHFITDVKGKTIKLWDTRMMSTSINYMDGSVETYNRHVINLHGAMCHE